MFTVLAQFKAAVDNTIDNIINNEKMQILINVYNRYLIINGNATVLIDPNYTQQFEIDLNLKSETHAHAHVTFVYHRQAPMKSENCKI